MLGGKRTLLIESVSVKVIESETLVLISKFIVGVSVTVIDSDLSGAKNGKKTVGISVIVIESETEELKYKFRLTDSEIVIESDIIGLSIKVTIDVSVTVIASDTLGKRVVGAV